VGIVSEYIRNLIAKQVDDNGIGKPRGQALLFAPFFGAKTACTLPNSL
jgi:hypothetical protein